jgi:DNA polymerase III delta subunit
MDDNAECFRVAVEREIEVLEDMSESVAKTIREWTDLLVAGDHPAAGRKLQELPKITEMPLNLVDALSEIFASAVKFHLSVPQ